MATAMAYRSQPSTDSAASSKSYGPIDASLGQHISGDSAKTIEDTEELNRFIVQFTTLNPVAKPPVEEEMPTSVQATTSALISPDPPEFVDDATMGVAYVNASHRSFQDVQELHSRTHNFVSPTATCMQSIETQPQVDQMTHVSPDVEMATQLAEESQSVMTSRAFVPDDSTFLLVPVMQRWIAISPDVVEANVAYGSNHNPIVIDDSLPAANVVHGNGGSHRCQNASPATRRERSRSQESLVKQRGLQTHRPGGTESSMQAGQPAESSQHQNPQPPKELPPASEEDWSKRLKKRLEGLTNLKDSDFYSVNQDIRSPQRPVSPNPYDRSLSKRDWEKQLADCRGHYRFIHAQRQLHLQRLVEMGFEERRAQAALQEASDAENILEAAVQILLQ